MSDCKLVHVSLWTPFRITTNYFRPIYPDENGFTFHVCNVADTKLESDLFPILSAHFYTCLHICICMACTITAEATNICNAEQKDKLLELTIH